MRTRPCLLRLSCLGAVSALTLALSAPAAAQTLDTAGDTSTQGRPPVAPPGPEIIPPAPPIIPPPAPRSPQVTPRGEVGTNPAVLPTFLVPEPPRPAPEIPFFQIGTLRLLAQKGVLSVSEYEAAVQQLEESLGTRAADVGTLTLGRWRTSIYGFAQGDLRWDSTQSFNDFASNTQVARPGTYAGDNGRFQGSVRDSRFGFRVQAPETKNFRASAVLEMDFLGSEGNGTIGSATATVTEASFYTNPVLRVRHAYLKMETPWIDVVIGQYWDVFAWLPNYVPTMVEWPGVAAEIYARTMQMRFSHTFKSEMVNLELAIAAMRPPQRDSEVPEGQGGLRLTFNKWKAWHTIYMTGTALTPASIAVSGDVRGFAVPSYLAKPANNTNVTGLGIAANAYLPLYPGSKHSKNNSFSLIGEFVSGKGINDLYTGLNGGLTKNGTPTGGTAAASTDTDAGLVIFDAAGNVRVPHWTTFLVGAEYYVPGVNGRVALFANFSRSLLHDAASYANASADLTTAGIRDHEMLYEGGLLVDVSESIRLAMDYVHLEDTYADGITAKNETVHFSGFFYF